MYELKVFWTLSSERHFTISGTKGNTQYKIEVLIMIECKIYFGQIKSVLKFGVPI